MFIFRTGARLRLPRPPLALGVRIAAVCENAFQLLRRMQCVGALKPAQLEPVDIVFSYLSVKLKHFMVQTCVCVR